jgi:hypothetical protein
LAIDFSLNIIDTRHTSGCAYATVATQPELFRVERLSVGQDFELCFKSWFLEFSESPANQE